MKKHENNVSDLVADLISGTAIENDEAELDRLRALPPKEQLEVSIVLREAMLQQKVIDGARNEELARVKRVTDAQHFLNVGRC